MDFYKTYRKVFTSTADEPVSCWYLGTLFAQPDGYPEIPITMVATIMVYRTETLSPDSCNIHWDEIGAFTEFNTGRLAESWLNPITGTKVKLAPGFAEGPAYYTVKAAGEGVALALVQPGATVEKLTVASRSVGDRILIHQTEHKTRGMHSNEGKLPEPGSDSAFRATTVLSFYAAQQDIADPARTWAPATGSYSFEMGGLAPWMGFGAFKGKTVVRGVVHKAATKDQLNPVAWRQLEKLYPKFSVFADAHRRRCQPR